MPIASYIAYPQTGQRTSLIKALSARDDVTVIPSSNRDVIVVVTDTRDQEHEEVLTEYLRSLDSLLMLAMASGYSDEAAG